jgi:hypothetical protein
LGSVIIVECEKLDFILKPTNLHSKGQADTSPTKNKARGSIPGFGEIFSDGRFKKGNN